MNILLVEDTAINVDVITYQLSKLGHTQVRVATDGSSALEISLNEIFSVIIMDIELPDMSGIDVVRAIRGAYPDNPNRETPVIGMTAYLPDDVRKECFDVGMNAFLPKPVRKEAIDQVLSDVFSGCVAPSESPVAASHVELLARQQAIEVMGGDEKIYMTLWNIFVEEAPGRLERLEKAISRRDYVEARRYAHQFKGLCKTMGCYSSSTLCLAMLQAIKDEDENMLSKTYKLFKSKLNQGINIEQVVKK
ncbi:response regulator [Maridesulfovibrio sp.]|uniref:response regulator n=1 Tax=Maridesulfovibrio sp. TaxID=2795000 RepID=UPI0029C9EB8F|nr:response regulator [Maridesulfovibrio sp.]